MDGGPCACKGTSRAVYHRSCSIPGHWYRRGTIQGSQLRPHAPSSIASTVPCLDVLQVSDPFSFLTEFRPNLCSITIQSAKQACSHVKYPANAKRGTSDNQGILRSLNGSSSSPSYGAFFLSKLPPTFCRPWPLR